MFNYKLLILIVSSLAILVNGHSWIACTDYAIKNAGTYDHSQCRGYARFASQYAPKGGLFGGDNGFDYHPSESVPCKAAGNNVLEYDSNHPMAVYYPGQQVVLAHPMKNHGADTCTNAHIPDNGNWLRRGPKDDSSGDPNLSEFVPVADLGISPTGAANEPTMSVYPKPGFQNAPNFCENTNLALGTYSFNVPNDLSPGVYTFIWLWGFNSPTDLYSTCFEVDIVGSLSERNTKLQANGFSNLMEPCGELTSDGVTMGNSNPGCTPLSGTTTSSASTTTATTTSTQATTTTTGTTTTQQPGVISINNIHAYQMAGDMDLPPYEQGTERRFISVHFDCPGSASFWNIRVIGQHNVDGDRRRKKRHIEGVHYDLMQEGASEISSGKLYFHATFTTPCNLQAYPPIATLIRDE